MSALADRGFLRRGFPRPAEVRRTSASEHITVTRHVNDPALDAELTLTVELSVFFDAGRWGQALARLALTGCDARGEPRTLREALLFDSVAVEGEGAVGHHEALVGHVRRVAMAPLGDDGLARLTAAFALDAQERLSP